MKAYDVIAYLGDFGIYCTDCGDDECDDLAVIFADEGLDRPEACEGCGAFWDPEDYCWYPPDVDADEALREVCLGS